MESSCSFVECISIFYENLKFESLKKKVHASLTLRGAAIMHLSYGRGIIMCKKISHKINKYNGAVIISPDNLGNKRLSGI